MFHSKKIDGTLVARLCVAATPSAKTERTKDPILHGSKFCLLQSCGLLSPLAPRRGEPEDQTLPGHKSDCWRWGLQTCGLLSLLVLSVRDQLETLIDREFSKQALLSTVKVLNGETTTTCKVVSGVLEYLLTLSEVPQPYK